MKRFLALLLVLLCGTGSVVAQQVAQQGPQQGAPQGGQQGPGSLRGSVEDTSGPVLTGAVIQLRDDSARPVREGRTDGSGAFTFDQLPAGLYRLTAAFTGFEPLARTVTIAAGRRTTMPKLVLRVAGITQDITVQQDVSAVTTRADANKDAIIMDAQSFNSPVGNQSSPFFGRSISAQPPRRVQLSASLAF